jgi:hypothetical protein
MKLAATFKREGLPMPWKRLSFFSLQDDHDKRRCKPQEISRDSRRELVALTGIEPVFED